MSGASDHTEAHAEPNGTVNGTATEGEEGTTAPNGNHTTLTLEVATSNTEDRAHFTTIATKTGWEAVRARTPSPSLIYFSQDGPQGSGFYGFRRFDSGHGLIRLTTEWDLQSPYGGWNFLQITDNPVENPVGPGTVGTLFRARESAQGPIHDTFVREFNATTLDIWTKITGYRWSHTLREKIPN